MSFDSLGLCGALLDSLSELEFSTPTSIQEDAIPVILQGRDVLASASTGSGKTAAYALPLLQRWRDADGRHKPQTLILVPTRELAQQVERNLHQFSAFSCAPKIVLLHGGVSINPQLMALRGGASFIIATPGRLLDVMSYNALRLKDIDTLVLDEADRLLDEHFAEELEALHHQLPDKCQVLMFSATFAGKVVQVAKQLLTDPVRIELQAPVEQITQRAIYVDNRKKLSLLLHLLQSAKAAPALIFTASRASAAHLCDKLCAQGINAAELYGGLPQMHRDRVLQDLKDHAIDALVATDLAARGIDIDHLPLVINFDLPRSPQTYIHRIGRTGRAGNPGEAISLIDADSQAHFRLIEKRLGQNLDKQEIPGFAPTDKPDLRLLVSDDNGGIKGKRLSKKDKLRMAAAAEPNHEP